MRERLIHKLDTFCEAHVQAKERIRARIWRLYADLKAYRQAPTPRRASELRRRFSRIFSTTTGFATLDRLLARLHAQKKDLLAVLARPEIPLHTNGSENDIRSQVTRRKISAGTRSDPGRDCRDAFLGLMKTCAKHAVRFWDYLGDRLEAPEAARHPKAGGTHLPVRSSVMARSFAPVTKAARFALRHPGQAKHEPGS